MSAMSTRMRALLVLLLAAAPAQAAFLAQDAPEASPAPESPRGLVAREPGALAGYTLFSPLLSKTTYLIDLAGEVVHRWETAFPPGNLAYLLPSGNLLRAARLEDNTVFQGGGIGGRIQEIDWEGKVVWDYRLSDEERCQHHDLEPLPNGRFLCIVWERLSREDALLFGRDPESLGPSGLWPDAVLELEPVAPDGARVVWEWHALDHLIQDLDPEKPNFGVVAEHPEKIDVNADWRDRAAPTEAERERAAAEEERMRALGYVGGAPPGPPAEGAGGGPGAPGPGGQGGPRGDAGRADWLHTNAVAWDPELDLIVLSIHNFHELWVIDHGTTTEEAAGSSGGRFGRGGDLLWRWGNPRMHGAGTPEDQRLFGQHDARWVKGPGGATHLLVFNNGSDRPQGDFSSVDELLFPLEAPGRVAAPTARGFPPEKLLWTYRAPEKESFFSGFISGAQRLPNGDTLICSGAPGEIFAVTPAGQVVWRYHNPFGGDVAPSGGGGRGVPPHALFRAEWLAPDHPGLARLAR